MKIQASILNVGFPKNVHKLENMLSKNEPFEQQLDIERIINYRVGDEVQWSSPKWLQEDDIVFFYHAKSASVTINRLKKYEGLSTTLRKALHKATSYYEHYGGKLFAVAKIAARPEYYDGDRGYHHFKGRIFAEIKDIEILTYPLQMDEFSDFIRVSRQSSITPVFGSEFDKLLALIKSNNTLSKKYSNIKGNTVPIKDADISNFILSAEATHRYTSESQFRAYYVDFLLKTISARDVFTECYCFKNDVVTGIVDNIIKVNDKHVFVEVKLNIRAEGDLVSQLRQYVNSDYLKISNGKGKTIIADIETQKMLVIDTEEVYVYSDLTGECNSVFNLSELNTPTALNDLRENIYMIFG